MNQNAKTASVSPLSQNDILYLNSNLTKKCKYLLKVLYKYQLLKHKDLAEILEITTSGLSNLMRKINMIQNEFIISKSMGRCKVYSLSPLAEAYTERTLLPKETARKADYTSFLDNDHITCDVRDSLEKFQEFEGEYWYIVLDDLLFVETKNKLITTASLKEKINQYNINYKEETFQNYINFKNALIALNVEHGRQAVQKIYGIIDQKILSQRLDFLLSNTLDDFYKMNPLFQLEKEDLQGAYSIIDRIFMECFPETFGDSSAVHSEPIEAKYCSIHSVILSMKNEFKNNNYDKADSIKQWEKKFHTKKHFSCMSYIAEKFSRVCETKSVKDNLL